VRTLWFLAAIPCLACSKGPVQDTRPAAGAPGSPDSTVAAEGREEIPAEWTVAEDTSAAGDVTIASLQLPAAKTIDGLSDDRPRLILRRIDGRVAAFISGAAESDVDSEPNGVQEPVPVQLDSAPPCE
jgi:hypothetical protein